MANVGTSPAGRTLIGTGNTSSPTFAAIGTLSGLTDHGVLIAKGANAFVATAAATNGQVLIGATGGDPAFATLTSSDGSITFTIGANTLSLQAVGFGKTITGNSGGALSPTAGNWDIVTANSTVKIVGATSTLTQDFGLSNLILGGDATGITSGARNVGLGLGNLDLLTSGTDNVAIGYNALKSSTSASLNTAVGSLSQQNITTGAGANTSIGYSSLSQCTSGTGNTALGYSALTSLTQGSDNCGVGNGALGNITTGTNNIGVGESGFNGGSLTGSDSNNICIGHPGVAGNSNTTRIGRTGSGTGQQNRLFLGGAYNIGIGATNLPLMVDSDDQFGTASTAGNSGIGYVSGSLTNAQIKALHATPITILPAPGAGKFYRVHAITGKFIYGGNNVFTAGAGQTIAVYLSTTINIGSLIPNAQLTGTTTTYTWANGFASTIATTGENQPLTLYNSNATEITGNANNDNTVTYNIVYQVVSI